MAAVRDQNRAPGRQGAPRFAVEDQGDRVVLSPAAYAALIGKVNLATETLKTLAQHPAFADAAPEFNEGGIGYETLKELRK